MNKGRILVLVGSLFLIIGGFCPWISVPNLFGLSGPSYVLGATIYERGLVEINDLIWAIKKGPFGPLRREQASRVCLQDQG